MLKSVWKLVATLFANNARWARGRTSDFFESLTSHVRCGAVAAALGDYSKESPALIEELNGLALPVRRALERGGEIFTSRLNRRWSATRIG